MKKLSEYINEDVSKSWGDFQELDVTHAVDKGMAAFWKEVIMSFPNAKTKDLAPDQAKLLRDAAMRAVWSWLPKKPE
jgi:hypothetical protein